MTVSGDVPPPAMISEHPSHHPGHKLNRVGNDGRFFICDGCMEPGVGTRYRCQHERCNFDLHTCCAVAPDTLTHPVSGEDRIFLFLLEPPPATSTAREIKGDGKPSGRACIACGEVVHGFVYHSFDDDEEDGVDLHPCCARLPEHALLEGHVFASGKEATRQRIMSDDDEKRSIKIDRPAAARHRRWVGSGTKPDGGRDEHPQPEEEGRRQAQRPSETCQDRNRGGREHRPSAARHRWWKH